MARRTLSFSQRGVLQKTGDLQPSHSFYLLGYLLARLIVFVVLLSSSEDHQNIEYSVKSVIYISI